MTRLNKGCGFEKEPLRKAGTFMTVRCTAIKVLEKWWQALSVCKKVFELGRKILIDRGKLIRRSLEFFLVSRKNRVDALDFVFTMKLACLFRMTYLFFLSFIIVGETRAEKICNCGTDGHETECCWEITEVINNGKTEKILTISPGTNSNGQAYTNVNMRNFGYTDKNSNITDEYPTTYISTAPWARQGITSVVVENGINNIGGHAFLGETKITSADMPNVTTLGWSVFHTATSLSSVNMPNVTKLGDYAFLSTSLTSVDLPKVTSIGKQAFEGATALEYVGLGVDENGNPLNVTLGNNAFNQTLVSSCSSTDRDACGSCGEDYVMSGLGCVSSCGVGYLGKEGRCIPAVQGCGANYKADNGLCWRTRYSPAEASKIVGEINTILLYYK